MEVIIEVLKLALPTLLGAGGAHLFNIRARIKRNKNEISEADFNTVSMVVKNATADLQKLAERIGELEKERLGILQEVSTLHDDKQMLIDEIKELRKENKRLDEALKRYIRRNNPTM
jgi:predicted nuclease with TOPRIM domain